MASSSAVKYQLRGAAHEGVIHYAVIIKFIFCHLSLRSTRFMQPGTGGGLISPKL